MRTLFTSLPVTASLLLLCIACKKNQSAPHTTITTPSSFSFNTFKVNGVYNGFTYYNVTTTPSVQLNFTAPLDEASVNTAITLKTAAGASIAFTSAFTANDSTVTVQPASALQPITQYTLSVSTSLESQAKGNLESALNINLTTSIDTTDKFPRITDSALLTLVEHQTFNYFWDNNDPTSGMAKERASATQVTTGGSGFGVMAMLVGVQRNFISRTDALNRITTIVNFLTNNVTTYHGAFSHWINGSTGATIPFSTEDNGGDIVETSYMLQGLLCARQYFNSTSDANEISLRAAINNLYNNVDYNWYRQGGQNALTWNWSPQYNFDINVQVTGWCEALITYVLGASSPNNATVLPKIVYTNGWAQNGGMKNGNSYFGIQLPLGPTYGGPLFFAHYSFLGINPNGLSDAYANYWTQDTAHAMINYLYCVNNPNHFNGYSDSCWGLTASDIQNGYSASSPTNDIGVIAPTAAISSLPYTPVQSMNALRFFYYKLGDKIWGQYGFVDAFNLTSIWFDNDYLAIDQGPEIVMIENYRSGLLWNLFMSCPEVQTGMQNLGFTSPYF